MNTTNHKNYRNGFIMAFILVFVGMLASVILLAQLSATKKQLNITQAELSAANKELVTAQTQLSTMQDDLKTVGAQVNELQTNLSRMSSSYGYVLTDPTFGQMQTFLNTDTTNQKPYIPGVYTCYNYAEDIITNAAKQHIRCAFVYVEFPELAHAVVAFNTTDEGMVYVEPQTDEVVQLQVGVRYYKSVIPKAGYYYPQPSYDDTVERFEVIW